MDVNKYMLSSFLDEINLIKEAVSPKWVSDTVANAVHDVPRHKLIEFADRMASKGHQAFRAANKTRATGSVSSTKRLEKNQIKYLAAHFKAGDKLEKRAVSSRWVGDKVRSGIKKVSPEAGSNFVDRMSTVLNRTAKGSKATPKSMTPYRRDMLRGRAQRGAKVLDNDERIFRLSDTAANTGEKTLKKVRDKKSLEKRAVSGPFITKAVSSAVGKVSPERATQFSRNMFNRATNLGNKARLSGQLGDVRQANKYNRLGDLAGRAWQGADTYAGKTW